VRVPSAGCKNRHNARGLSVSDGQNRRAGGSKLEKLLTSGGESVEHPASAATAKLAGLNEAQDFGGERVRKIARGGGSRLNYSAGRLL